MSYYVTVICNTLHRFDGMIKSVFINGMHRITIEINVNLLDFLLVVINQRVGRYLNEIFPNNVPEMIRNETEMNKMNTHIN
jgi:hypothetical protein